MVVVVAVATACSAVAPAPATPSAPAARASPSGPAAIDAGPAPTNRLGTLELDVGALDPEWVWPMLEFASDGDSVIYSSGVADGPGAEFAADLWRYAPGEDAPELLWRNPVRDRSLSRIGGDGDTWAFVDMPVDGSRAWNLMVLTEPGGEAIVLDTHPGDEDVSSLVPSFAVRDRQVAWTAFDRGPSGPVSQLLYAAAPDWEPQVLVERTANEAELWFPSLRGTQLAYTEVVYSADRRTDERHVYVMDLADPAAARRLDGSGLATMPLLVDGAVVWKEAERGFSMFNWGRLYRYDFATGDVTPVSTWPQEHVNYPSAGDRFIAYVGADAFAFSVADMELGRSRYLERYEPDTQQSIFSAHVAGDLLVWLYTPGGGGSAEDEPALPEIRYAFLPGARDGGTDEP
jgi:hypothetical protein